VKGVGPKPGERTCRTRPSRTPCHQPSPYYLTQRINEMVLESQLPHKIVNLLFTFTKIRPNRPNSDLRFTLTDSPKRGVCPCIRLYLYQVASIPTLQINRFGRTVRAGGAPPTSPVRLPKQCSGRKSPCQTPQQICMQLKKPLPIYIMTPRAAVRLLG